MRDEIVCLQKHLPIYAGVNYPMRLHLSNALINCRVRYKNFKNIINIFLRKLHS